MEDQNQESSLFGLNIDATGRQHLIEAAKWANFLAIVGFVFVGLIAVIAIFGGAYLSRVTGRYNRFGDSYDSGLAIGMIIYYLCVAVLVFLAYLFLYRFAVNMKMALRENNQEKLNRSFQNLKIMYRYVGILAIIGLSIFVLAFLVGIITASRVV